MITVYLVWTLIAGIPYDIDSFLNRDDCAEQMELWKTNLLKARELKPEQFNQVELVGCVPVQLTVPNLPEQRKQSM